MAKDYGHEFVITTYNIKKKSIPLTPKIKVYFDILIPFIHLPYFLVFQYWTFCFYLLKLWVNPSAAMPMCNGNEIGYDNSSILICKVRRQTSHDAPPHDTPDDTPDGALRTFSKREYTHKFSFQKEDKSVSVFQCTPGILCVVMIPLLSIN